jgi:hypothetical protein
MYFMFGKAKCKLCGDNVRFILKHLKEKHPETLNDKDVIQLKMSRIMENTLSNIRFWLSLYLGSFI